MEIWIAAYVVLMVSIAVMDGVLGIKSFRKNKTTGRYLGVACMWATIIDISYLCSILSKSYGFVSVMSSIYFMGIDGVLICLFIFTTYFTKGAFSRLEKVLTRICLVYALFDFVVLAVNPFCHIAIDYIRRNTLISCYRYEMKLLYQLHLVFSYAVVVCILFLLIRKICTTPNEYRSQYSVIVVGLLAVIGINAVFLFIPGDSVFSLLDYSICCYSLMSFLIYWNCFDYSTHAMLNKMKNRIFENIGQGIVLFDHENNRILHNKRAEVLLGREKLEHCGRLDEFMKQYELPVLKLGETNSYTVQCRVEENEKRQSLRCDVKMLRNEKGTRLGLMFVFSDIAVETDLQTGFQKWENFLPMTREAGEHFLFPVGIAVCDVNSLSVINATRGQDADNMK